MLSFFKQTKLPGLNIFNVEVKLTDKQNATFFKLLLNLINYIMQLYI